MLPTSVTLCVAAVAASLLALGATPAFGGTYFSVGATGASISTSTGNVALSANFSDQWHGTKIRILSTQVERRFKLADGYMIAPSLSLGHNVVGAFATDDAAAGLRVAKQLNKSFGLDAGVQLGRTFRASAPGADGAYRSAFVGADYKLGRGYLAVTYSETKFPAAIGSWNLKGVSVGYQFAF